MKKRICSRAKGARGERWTAAMFTRIGYPATRAARLGVDGGEDLVCESLRGIVHPEVKFTESIGLGTKELADAYAQAVEAALPGAVPCVIWKNSRKSVCLTYHDDCGVLATVCGELGIRLWLSDRVREARPQ